MFSEKVKNKHVIEMHKGKPHIRTEVTFLMPIKEQDQSKYEELMLHQKLEPTLKWMLEKVEEDIGETFECDVESVYVGLKNPFRKSNKS